MTLSKNYDFSKAGQVSIEYLLLLAVLLGAVSVMLGAASNIFNSGLFAIDAKNAKIFAGELEQKIGFLSVLSDGSQVEIEANPAGEWVVFFENQTIFVGTQSPVLGVSKKFGFSPALVPQFSALHVLPNSRLVLEKNSDNVLIKNG